MYVAETEFLAGLNAIVELQRTGGVRLIVGRGSRVQFEVLRDADEVTRALAEQDLTVDRLEDVAVDISDVLTAAISGFEDGEFAERRSVERPGRPEVEPEDPELARRKYLLATEVFSVPELQRRAWVKKTSLADVPHAVEWEVGVKHADDTLSLPGGGPIPFATVRLVTEATSHSYLPQYNEVAFTVDEEDASYLIDTLTRLRAKLQTVQEARDSE